MKNVFIASLLFLSLLTACQKKPDCMVELYKLDQEQLQLVEQQTALFLNGTIYEAEYLKRCREIQSDISAKKEEVLQDCE